MSDSGDHGTSMSDAVTPHPTPDGSRRRALLVAVAVVAVVVAGLAAVWALTGGETADEAPATSAPASEPTTTSSDDGGAPSTAAPSTAPPATSEPSDPGGDPDEITEDLAQRDWDADGGTCLTVTTGDGIGPAGTTMCVTGDQLASEFRAYLTDDGRTWAYHHGASTPGTGWAGGSISVPPDEEACGLPLPVEVPTRRWIVVSHCADGASLLTVLPTAPDVPPAYLVSSNYGLVVDAYLRQTLDHDTGAGIERFELFEAPSVLSGVVLGCHIVAPANADRWFETCRGPDEPGWNSLFVHDGLPYLLEGTGEARLTPLPIDARLSTNGCTSAVIEVLAALADPAGVLGATPALMVTGVACPAASDPFSAPMTDAATSARFAGVLLRAGPMDGGLVTLERGSVGDWGVTDLGTGIEPNPWPLDIPPAAWITDLGDALPPIDVTDTLAAEIPVASTKEALVEEIRSWIARGETFEGGPAPEVTAVADLPLVIARVIAADDSIDADTYAIWLLERDPEFDTTWSIERAIRVTSCVRGVTEVDGALLCL